MEKGYTLSGKLIDANGRTGTIEAVVSDADPSIANWTISLRERKHDYKIQGRSKIAEEGNMLTMQSLDDQKQESGEPWKASLRKCDPARYARAAYLGEYQVQKKGENTIMSEGIIALWNFK